MKKLLFLPAIVLFAVLTACDVAAANHTPGACTPETSLVTPPGALSRSPHLRAAVLYGSLIQPAGIYSPDLPCATETGVRRKKLNEPVRDPWLAFDKAQHLTFGFLLTLGGQYTLVNKLSMSERGALPLSISASMVVGVTKEVYDWKVGPTRFFSLRDLAADALGAALATVLILI
jgi:uncharacterized protein YfiM (DUF2279 family)